MDDVTRLLADLVAIPSVNPMGRPLAGPIYFEGGMTAYLERFFHDRDIPHETHVVAPGRCNVIARYDAPGSRRTILFDAHQDTVPVDHMTIPPFEPAIRGDRLYGRGSCDVKGGMAAMLSALVRLRKERPRGSASVTMACTVDEEYTHLGSSHLARDCPGPYDLAVVAEPTKLDLVTTHKGAVRWKVRTRGVACHSSTPLQGINAIYRMARVVVALAEYASALSEARPDPVLGPPSLSVGRIEGGQSVNVVPDWCEVEIDRRVIPGEVASECPSLVATFLEGRLGDLEGVEFLPPWVRMPALVPGVPSDLLGPVAGAVRDATGREPAVSGVPYGTDAGPLAQAGLPSLVLGPGDIGQAHTEDEWIDLGQVGLAAEVYYRIALALG